MVFAAAAHVLRCCAQGWPPPFKRVGERTERRHRQACRHGCPGPSTKGVTQPKPVSRPFPPPFPHGSHLVPTYLQHQRRARSQNCVEWGTPRVKGGWWHNISHYDIDAGQPPPIISHHDISELLVHLRVCRASKGHGKYSGGEDRSPLAPWRLVPASGKSKGLKCPFRKE